MFEKRRGWRFKNESYCGVVVVYLDSAFKADGKNCSVIPLWEVNDGAESRASVSGQGYKGTSMCRITTQSCYDRDQPFL